MILPSCVHSFTHTNCFCVFTLSRSGKCLAKPLTVSWGLPPAVAVVHPSCREACCLPQETCCLRDHVHQWGSSPVKHCPFSKCAKLTWSKEPRRKPHWLTLRLLQLSRIQTAQSASEGSSKTRLAISSVSGERVYHQYVHGFLEQRSFKAWQ